jgi:DNA repair exonuclease SbcCD ATPase subunit
MANESEFLINIRTILEGQGIKLTESQFADLKKEVTKTTEAATDYGKEGEKAHDKVKEGAHKAELGHRELRESVSAVAAQFGGLADVGLWLNPMTAALAAVLFLVEKLKERFNEATEAAENLATQTDAINIAGMKGLADAARSAAESVQALAIEQAKLNTAYADGDTAMQSRIVQYAAERDAVMKVEEAKEQAFEAEIRRQVVLVAISKDRGDAIIAQAKLELEKNKGLNDQAKLQEEITEHEKQLAAARRNLESGADENAVRSARAGESPFAQRAGASAEAAEQAAKGKFSGSFTTSGGGTENFTGTTDELRQRIQKLRQDQQENEELGHPDLASQYSHDAEQLEDILKRQEKYIENLKTIAELDKQKLTAAKAHTEQADEQFRRDSEINRTAPDQIQTLRDQYQRQARTNADVLQQHRNAAATNADAAHIDAMRHGPGAAQ